MSFKDGDSGLVSFSRDMWKECIILTPGGPGVWICILKRMQNKKIIQNEMWLKIQLINNYMSKLFYFFYFKIKETGLLTELYKKGSIE